MAEEFDTSWFNLKNYEALKTMPIEGWIFQLEKRCQYYELEGRAWEDMIPDEAAIYFAPIVTELKAGVIPDDPNFLRRINAQCEAASNRDYSSTGSVSSVSSIDLWYMSKESRLGHVWDACQHASDFVIHDDLDNDQFEIACTPHELNIKKYSRFDRKNSAYVAINLSATDPQIKKDFDHWLKNYRKATGHYNETPKKKSPEMLSKKVLYTQEDFDYWIRFCVVPYLDLTLIAKLEGKIIKQAAMGKLIFPDELNNDNKNPVGIISATTQPTAKWLIKTKIHRTLLIQLVSQKENRMKNS